MLKTYKFSRSFFAQSLFRNVTSLYAVQLVNYVLPLVTVPYLARVLGPDAWGRVLFAQSLGLWLVLWVEYGFNLSATREIARHRAERMYVAKVVSGVMGAKGILIVGSACVTVLIGLLVPVFHSEPSLLWWAWIWGIAQGLSPLWYFHGYERMQFLAVLEIGGKLAALLAIFLFVRAPEDGWKFLAFQAAGSLVASVIGTVWMYREVPIVWPNWMQVWTALRMGASMFLFRTAVSLYTSLNTFLLGLFVSPVLVAYFGGAERISRAIVGLLQPISQTLYPRINHLVAREDERAAYLARICFIWTIGISIFISLLVMIFAPQIVEILLGPEYRSAVPVLRVLILMIPLISASNVMGLQWMIPQGMDRAFNVIIIGAGLLNVTLAFFLAQNAGAQGMAWAVVFSEAFVTGAMWYRIKLSGKTFWRKRWGKREI